MSAKTEIPPLNASEGNSKSSELLSDGERPNWGSPVEFILSCMNFALGLGNVWRYPYLAYRNGGGAFLIPYFLAACIIGLPIFFVELLIGQYSGLGPIMAFSYLAPLFKGLGYCTLVIISFFEIYYFVIVAWVLFYFYHALWPDMKWGSCDNSWNTQYCYNLIADLECQERNSNVPGGLSSDEIFFNQSCKAVGDICIEYRLLPLDGSHCFNQSAGINVTLQSVAPRVLSSEEFFYEHTLGIGDATWTNWGWPRYQMVISLFVAYFLCAMAIIKGVKSVGKVVYFTATFPFVILTALLIRGVTLPGSIDGILFYVTPQWDRLLSPRVWGDASSQIFYSFSLAIGSLITLASYNKFKNNCHFDAVFVSIINYCTAFYAGLAVFSILGFLAHTMQVEISEVATSGPGLSFVTFPEAILLMPGSQVWAILFFFMMIILGLGSTFAGVQMITTTILDQWPNLRKEEWKVTIAVCLTGFICGIPMTCPGGIYLFTLLEWHTVSWAILLVGFAEVIILSWVYGFSNTFDMINEMGMKIYKWMKNFYWKPLLVVITPIYTVGIFVFILTGIGPTQFRGYIFPVWADTMGWLFGVSTLIPFLIFGIMELIKYYKLGDLKALLKPTEFWGPQEVDGRRVDRTRTDRTD